MTQNTKSTLLIPVLASVMLVTSLVFGGYNFWKSRRAVQLDKVNNYVCEIIDVDMDSHMMALRCLCKEPE